MTAAVALQGRGAAEAQPPDTTSGFVITDQVTIRRCAGCHVRDSTGRLGRLSYMRKTPEGWEASIRRMVTLNGVRLDPAEARSIVKYLSNELGLAPAELRGARFEVERRPIEFRYTADAVTERTCRACHSLGRVLTQRRTRGEWELLMATHRGYYPNSDFQAFRRGSPPPPDSAGAPHPMDQAVAHLSRAFPLRTREWAAWSATMRPAPVEGAWQLSGHQPGRGSFFGRMVIARVPGTSDEFTTSATWKYAANGQTATHSGRAVVYTGYQWRGRSASPGDSSWREVMMVEPGWQEASGRWFRGGYDEFGMDVTIRRISAGPSIAGVSRRGLPAGGRDLPLTIFGSNLPRLNDPVSVDFGPGVRISRVVRSTADEIALLLNVDAAAGPGRRDLFVAGAAAPGAVVVHGKVDRIAVTPRAGMARVGGVQFPKQFAQFEAIGFWNGPDARPETDDDVEIGPVDVAWSIEEYGVTYQDDDVRWVGKIDAAGMFTPALDGPNPQRKGNRNNIGDVWVVAVQKNPPAGARPLRARAHLLVTVPLYMRWEPARTAP
ncbi:MAG: quinohemoprotein amine dehydrogenase subunit alpha [Gemmatimonadota bacterium]